MSKTKTVAGQQQIEEVRRILKQNDLSQDQILQQISESLSRNFEVFNWVGFYLVDPEAERELVLGPFVGKPTQHTRIPFGQGICGQAAESEEAFVVQDVSKANNYLACSLDVKAEIVLPIIKNDHLAGELDIDSNQKNSITKEHEEMLKEICNMVAEIF